MGEVVQSDGLRTDPLEMTSTGFLRCEGVFEGFGPLVCGSEGRVRKEESCRTPDLLTTAMDLGLVVALTRTDRKIQRSSILTR